MESQEDGFSDENSISDDESSSQPRAVSVEDEAELKEIVNEYQRSEERKKRL